jgi:Cof subfamily protein (haloacid dehalogenase superfamily)
VVADRFGAGPATVAGVDVRAIATDLDGTLLGSDGRVSARTRAAIDAAEDAGILFVVATGRPPRWIPPVVEQIGERGLVVCANGASVYDPARHELVARHDLSPAVAAELVDELEQAFPDAVLGVEQGFDFAVDESHHRTGVDLSWIEGLRVGPIRSFLDEPVTKLIVRMPPGSPPGTAASVQAVVGERALVTHSTDESFLELSRPDVHKAATVEALLEGSGIRGHEVVAFGDMPNDLELICWAGLGVAMANGHPDLRAAADEVTASNDDDGVALVVERVLEGP